jgi:hypothetical protein
MVITDIIIGRPDFLASWSSQTGVLSILFNEARSMDPVVLNQ